jgi:hypothetical protein
MIPVTTGPNGDDGAAAAPSSPFGPAEMDRLAADLNRDGICVLRGLFPRSKVEAWRRAFDTLFRERQGRPGGLAPRETARYYLTLPLIPPFADADVFAHPAILGVLDRVFAQEYVMVQLGADVPLRGSDYQETHRDYRPLFTDEIVTPLYALAVNFPLVDVTPDNGPFEMARGTHVLPRAEGLARIASGEIPLEPFLLRQGDVMIRTPLALHRGTPNRTDTPRPMVVMGYVMHWLHTPNVDLTFPRGYHESLPEPTRRRLRCQVVDELPAERVETYLEFKH